MEGSRSLPVGFRILKCYSTVSVVSQDIKYSLDYEELVVDIDSATSVQLEYGSLEAKSPAEDVSVIASAPYSPGQNVYFAVQTNGADHLKVRAF